MMYNDRRQEILKLNRILGSNTVHRLIKMGFTEAPASTKYHGCYDGGLFDHSIAVANQLIRISRKLSLPWGRMRSPYIVGIMHDLCKVDQYRKLPEPIDGKVYEYVDTEIKGHGSKSVIYAKRIIDLTPEEEYCIRWHMGAFGDENEQNGYGRAVQTFPNVLWTHTADMLASHVSGV